MWDVQGQILGLPLYRLLGGGRQRVPAYASALEFHLTDEQVVGFYARARAAGFSTFKVRSVTLTRVGTFDDSNSYRKPWDASAD